MTRDPRFDGKFFTAVKTTKVYCRPICPATTPKEENVLYFSTAIEAASAGYRPCLRCRPDSAPGSPAWKGVNTTLDRAIRLIDEGILQNGSMELLSHKLGISDRYLRKLFKTHLGVSPKSYALYQQCLFAKQLLHQTKLPIIQIAIASGFNSVRRFNDCFRAQLGLTPSQVRKSPESAAAELQLELFYRPPYDWSSIRDFFISRAVSGLEWHDTSRYGRTFELFECSGKFTAQHIAEENKFLVTVQIDEIAYLKSVINNIRRILDLDVDIQLIENDLKTVLGNKVPIKPGLRIPGTWNMFEAGVRAILGQQVSVGAAQNLVISLVRSLGRHTGKNVLFPRPESIIKSRLEFLKIPESRKQALAGFARHYCSHKSPNDTKHWVSLKGIGPWTINYARMRGISDPDIFLDGDLGIKKVLSKATTNLDIDQASPWKSYLTLQLWNQI